MEEKFEKFSIENSVIDVEHVDFHTARKSDNPIVFDTNFLFVTFEFKVDIIREVEKLVGKTYNLFIYSGTISELANLEKKKNKNKKFLPLILTMLKTYNFKIIDSELDYIDDQIMSDLSKKVIIATNDKELKLRIWDNGGRVMYLRQKAYLEIK